MEWKEVCEHSSLKDLPFKIELNENGEIIMNAVKVIHSLYQGEQFNCYLKITQTYPKYHIMGNKYRLHELKLGVSADESNENN